MKGMSLRENSTQLKRHACVGPCSAQRCACTHCLPANAVCRAVGGRWMRSKIVYTAPLQRRTMVKRG